MASWIKELEKLPFRSVLFHGYESHIESHRTVRFPHIGHLNKVNKVRNWTLSHSVSSLFERKTGHLFAFVPKLVGCPRINRVGFDPGQAIGAILGAHIDGINLR